MTDAWQRLLDRMQEWTVVERRRVTSDPASSGPVEPAPVPPVDLGPLPSSCVDRARSVLSELAELQGELERAQCATRRELQEQRRLTVGARTGSARPPVYLDGRA